MLPKAYRLRQQKDFDTVFQRGGTAQNEFLMVRFLRNQRSVSRFGLVLSAKVAKKAVDRNRLRRQINEIIRLNLEAILSGLDFVFVIKRPLLEKSYQELETVLVSLLEKKKLYGQKNSELCP